MKIKSIQSSRLYSRPIKWKTNNCTNYNWYRIIELILSSYLKSSNTRLNSNILWLCLILLLFLLNDILIYNFLGTSCFQPFLAWVSHVEQEILFLPENTRSPPDLCGVRVARSLPCCVMFWGSLFVLLFFFCWPLCYLSFFIKSFLQIRKLYSTNSLILDNNLSKWVGHMGNINVERR
jgi:hypothetical protein